LKSSKLRTWISNIIFHGFSIFNDLRLLKVFVCFVDIDGIVDHHFLFTINVLLNIHNDVGNPGPSLGQAQKCGVDKPVNGISILLY
jgi:hypothetical protein